MKTTSAEATSTKSRRSNGLGTGLFNMLSSVWFGIAMLVVLFVYSSIGSALPTVRQHRWFDKTEMEWFNWWPFYWIIGLLCLNIAVVTVRRIPLRLPKMGVWAVHVGILILAAGSVWYFGTKLEGDTVVFRRQAVITVPGVETPAYLLTVPGNRVSINAPAGDYTFAIASVDPEWPILKDGKQVGRDYSVAIDVQTPQHTFRRQLWVAYPESTMDTPLTFNGGNASDAGLIDDTVQIQLGYVPQDVFFLQHSGAVFLREQGASQWNERPIPGMPHYNDRIQDMAHIWTSRDFQLDPFIRKLSPENPNSPVSDIEVTINGFLRYAQEERRWTPGGQQLNPVIDLQVTSGINSPTAIQLLAFSARNNTTPDGEIAFRWVETPAQLEALKTNNPPHLAIEVPGRNVSLNIPIMPRNISAMNPGLGFEPIAGTQYAYRIRNVADNLTTSDGRIISVAIVEMQTEQGLVRRFAAQNLQDARDMRILENGDSEPMTPDPGIQMIYHPAAGAPITVAAGPAVDGLQAYYRDETGAAASQSLTAGSPAMLGGATQLLVRNYFQNARLETRPVIVPLHQRMRNAGEMFSMVRATVRVGDWNTSLWLPFNSYALPSEQYAVQNRLAYQPRTVILPDGRQVELLFSRQRHSLDTPVVLEDFILDTHAGGFTGQTTSVRDFVSKVRFPDDTGRNWSKPVTLALNEPVQKGEWWLFQAQWDPPEKRGEYRGQNYTGLGVGNRHGVHVQLFGGTLAVIGMFFAFYIKPLIIRRRIANTGPGAPVAATA